MITKDNIKLAEIVVFKEKNKSGDLIIGDLSMDQKYRKVVLMNNLLIDIETSEILTPYPSIKSRMAKLNVPYYKNIHDLLYVTNEDYKKGLIACNNFLNTLNYEEEKILKIKAK